MKNKSTRWHICREGDHIINDVRDIFCRLQNISELAQDQAPFINENLSPMVRFFAEVEKVVHNFRAGL